jgi:hypothetical protein
MSAVLFDTHEVVRGLKAAGFTDEQAEAVTRLVRDSRIIDLSNLATKTDLAPLATKVEQVETKTELKTDLIETRAELKVALAETKAEILKWMVSSIGIQTVVIIGAVVALVRMHQ